MSSFFGGGEQQDVRLTEQEQKLVAKLLSDPTYFPLEFRTWLKNYIEGAGINVTFSQIRGASGAATGLPAGIFVLLGGTGKIPPDLIACDGAAVNRVTQKALFDVIGTSWGVGDGSTTFNVPDTRDRALFGAGQVIGVGASDGHPFGSRSGWRHSHSFDLQVGVPQGTVEKGDVGLWEAVAANTQATAIGGTIGSGNTDGPTWAGVVMTITTGKTA